VNSDREEEVSVLSGGTVDSFKICELLRRKYLTQFLDALKVVTHAHDMDV
jgi:hypothetical protein